MTAPTACPACRSISQSAAEDCHNPWHRGLVVHFQRDPIGTPDAECRAACGGQVDDAPSELAIRWEFVSCPSCLVMAPDCDRRHPAPSCADPACYREGAAHAADSLLPGLGDLVRKGVLDPDLSTTSATVEGAVDRWKDQATILIGCHHVLSNDKIEQASPEELRAAYRGLLAETTAVAARHGDLARRYADLAEVVDFMQNRYSPIGGRPCALCVYEDGRFVRSCAMHRWESIESALPPVEPDR